MFWLYKSSELHLSVHSVILYSQKSMLQNPIKYTAYNSAQLEQAYDHNRKYRIAWRLVNTHTHAKFNAEKERTIGQNVVW